MEFRREVEECYLNADTTTRRRVCQRVPFLDTGAHLADFIKILIAERPPVRVYDAVLQTVGHTFTVLTGLAERPAIEKTFPTYLRLPNEKSGTCVGSTPSYKGSSHQGWLTKRLHVHRGKRASNFTRTLSRTRRPPSNPQGCARSSTG